MQSDRLAVKVVVICLLMLAVARGDDLAVPVERLAGGDPATMMQRYWLGLADRAAAAWQDRYEQLKTPEQVRAYQQSQRGAMLEMLGGLPERTPLSARVTSVTQRDGYRVEKILFASQPGHDVTGLLFLPDASRLAPPYPGVLIPCGHSMNGKAHPEYQLMGAALAYHGMAALVFDPIDQGERGQYLGAGGWPKLAGTRAHSMLGVAATLLGQNTARFEIWDAIRAVDYLQSRPEIDGERIGCTGNSGGGTQTSYLMALDDRIRVAAPSCYLCGFPALLHTIGPQDAEQNLYGQVARGLDHADYVIARAPAPVLLCAATKDFFDIHGTWQVFRSGKRLYTRLGFAEHIDLMENDAGHNYNTLQRQSVLRWMSRWLLGKDESLTEPDLKLLNEQEVLCTPDGTVMNLPGARSVYDLNRDYEAILAPRRAEAWRRADMQLREVRRLAGIRPLHELPAPQVQAAGTVDRSGQRIRQLIVSPEAGIDLPALHFAPAQRRGRVVLYLHEAGKSSDAAAGGPIQQLVDAGDDVLAVDLRGVGQTRAGGAARAGASPSGDGKGVGMAYLLGKSYVGCRAEDILVCARFAAEQIGGDAKSPIHLIAVGQVGVPALHAAALEPAQFATVHISRMLRAWSDIVQRTMSQDQAVNVVHGALTQYDLPDLASSLGPKLTLTAPLDPLGQPWNEEVSAAK